MFLERLEIQGFKSFASKTELVFPDKINGKRGITAVVGPNGSGKSNVADAIRWVLGEQSPKVLRCKKSEDIIFAGSDIKSRLGFAEATLVLNNEDKNTDVDYPMIEITRRVYRTGESEYYLNKQKARLNDILLLLAKANFGQKTYSVIGQGMADSVLSASLAERKEFFDEAVGVKQYQIKREHTLNKFKATRENLAQTELTIQEVEPRLRSLSRQVKKLEQREEIEKNLLDCQMKYYSRLWHKLNIQVEEQNKAKAEIDQQTNRINKEIISIQKQIEQLAAADTVNEAFEKLQNQYATLVNQKNTLLREQALLKAKLDIEYQKMGQGNIVFLNQRIEELGNKISQLDFEAKGLDSQIAKDRAELENKKINQEQILKKIANIKNELADLRDKSSLPFDAEAEIENIFEKYQNLLNLIAEATDLAQLKNLQEQAKEIAQKLSLYIEKLKTSKKVNAKDLTNLQSQLEDLMAQNSEIMLNINSLSIAIKQKEEKKEYTNSQVSVLTNEKAKLDNELKLSQLQAKDKGSISEEIEKQNNEIEAKINTLENEISGLQIKISQFSNEEQNKKADLIKLQRDFSEKQNQANSLNLKLNEITIELTRNSTRIEDAEREIKESNLQLVDIKNFAVSEEADKQDLLSKIHQYKAQLELIGGIDAETMKEYTETKERYEFLSTQMKDLEEAIKSLEQVIEELDEVIKKQFDTAFSLINKEFQKYFQILFNGGKAELIKVTAASVKEEAAAEKAEGAVVEEDEEGVLAQAEKFAKKLKAKEKESYAGIEIKAVPPGKKITSINQLSGGERALTSIALISAIISNNPSPFVVLDEMDAALDEANSERFAQIVDDLSNKTQFVLITHNRATMHQAHVLYGVTMGEDGVSKLLSVKLEQAEAIAQ